MLIQYDGSAYHGWQIQKGQETIQGILEQGLEALYGHRIPLVGSGRTDSGVHALGQVAHFDCADSSIPPFNMGKALNQKLPADVRILASCEVAPEFHSRFDARERSYEYRISAAPNVLRRDSEWLLRYPVNRQLLDRLASSILGEHDFSSFCYAGTETINMICNIMDCHWVTGLNDELIFQIKGSRFLHHMVRMLVGSMIEVGRGKWSIDRFEELLKNPDRQAHVITAPAHGLALVKVSYPEELQPDWEGSQWDLARIQPKP